MSGYYWESFKEFLFLAGVLVAIGLGFLVPIVYLSGRANAKWIKQTRGIELEWYEAAFIDVEVNSVDAAINGNG